MKALAYTALGVLFYILSLLTYFGGDEMRGLLHLVLGMLCQILVELADD